MLERERREERESKKERGKEQRTMGMVVGGGGGGGESISRPVHPAQEFAKVDVDHRHIPVRACYSALSLFVVSSLNLCVLTVTTRGNPARLL